ncbi:hypothetical protein [Campylobacter sp. RM16192]|uniref:hypothetical protein n=1 Tax=Campylobacter sp. RM16192 TaxID=1660080 RepID=UPI0014521CC6|nr:hypothetical protein [Campylobacter sp. RM16192]QCD53069.1 hypothetical protein CDOMC_1467 [Campylobacter sp. RM16192]
MKAEIYKFFEDKKIVLKNLKEIDLSKFTKKRTLVCTIGIDIKDFYNIVFIREAKSRFLKKEFEEILEIYSKIQADLQINFKKKTIFYSSSICSKTQISMKENGFSYDFV